ncbi:MAG: sensor domain-containing diguanylate cyclase [Candidatus Schekmanbacteria bacterium]|nr:sensor domain-containing diguanylate cyclase [Candidatus Schekmanbacteria bacterium]
MPEESRASVRLVGEHELPQSWVDRMAAWGYEVTAQPPEQFTGGGPVLWLQWDAEAEGDAALLGGTPLITVAAPGVHPGHCDFVLPLPPDPEALRQALEEATDVARLVEEVRDLRQRYNLIDEEIELLRRPCRSTGRETTADDLLRSLGENLEPLVRATAWFVGGYDADRNELAIVSAAPSVANRLLGARLRIRGRMLYRVLQSRTPLIVTSVTAAADGGLDRELRELGELAGGSPHELLAVPIHAFGRTFGLICIFDPRAHPSAALVDALEAVARHTASVIENARLHEEIRRLSVFDDLTEVYNFQFFEEVLARELTRATSFQLPLALIFIDLDGFKGVNDQYGHALGSRVLREVGRFLQSSVRRVDIVGRFGGDEFVILLPQANAEGADIVATRLRARLLDHRFLGDMRLDIHLSLSAGIATFPEPCRTREELLGAADQAMYRAKANTRNSIEHARESDVR